ncbi:uncharacterized protein LOC126828623 [Patella vulgata]|uniref:uncharacterized protein LOC126828623 n=1 Tax=Patella vulgata TaxID=6465 RepID=UPI00217FE954|nr:uncharacterized protein LOC126828623 [Patella vulgata]
MKMNTKTVPVCMYSLGVFIMVLTGHMRVIQGQENCQVPGSSSSICSTLDLQGSKFNISGLQPGQQVAGCLCILTFNGSSYVSGPITINATANIPAGCQHEVYFIHNSTTKRYSCKVFKLMYTFNVAVQDKLQMILVSGERSTGGFQFCFKISTKPELDMRLVCNETNTTGMIPPTTTTAIISDTTLSSIPSTTSTAILSNSTVSSTSTTTITEITPDTARSSMNGMNPSTTTTEIKSDTARTSINGMTPSTTTEIMPDTAVPKSTQTTTDERVTDQNTNLTSTDENDDIVQSKLGVIIGGSVGGPAVIIVIIIIILCVRRNRRKDKT